MSIIPTSKFGRCFSCGDQDVPCVKVGKNLYCRDKCHRANKVKQQVTRANQRVAVRSLGTYQKENELMDSRKELMVDLDRVVSRYVRLAAMGLDHKCECFTCNVRKDWQKIQCGHFIPRAHISTRWELANLRCQCGECNTQKYGNIEVFKIRLEEERKGITDWLQEQAREVDKVGIDELKMLLFDFQQKVKLVETKLK